MKKKVARIVKKSKVPGKLDPLNKREVKDQDKEPKAKKIELATWDIKK